MFYNPPPLPRANEFRFRFRWVRFFITMDISPTEFNKNSNQANLKEHTLYTLKVYKTSQDYRPYSKTSLTLSLNEWMFNLSLPCVSLRFLNSWRFSVVHKYVTTFPPDIPKWQWYTKEAQNEPPLIE